MEHDVENQAFHPSAETLSKHRDFPVEQETALRLALKNHRHVTRHELIVAMSLTEGMSWEQLAKKLASEKKIRQQDFEDTPINPINERTE